MRTTLARTVVSALFIASVSVGLTLAGEGRIPIFEPTTITKNGHYFLSRDIVAETGDGVVIAAANVRLDLNGFEILVKDPTGRGAIIIPIEFVGLIGPMIIVENGRINGGLHGIFGDTYGAGVIPVPAGFLIKGVDIAGTASDAIHLENVGPVKVSDSFLINVGGDGLHVGCDMNYPCIITATDNVIEYVMGSGIFLSDPGGGRIAGNTIRNIGLDGNAAAGISVTATGAGGGGLLIEHNVIAGGGAKTSGIVVDSSAGAIGPTDIVGNAASGMGETGIDVMANAVRVAENVVAGNGGDGVRVSGQLNLIEGNQLAGNGLFGLRFLNGEDHAYRGNYLRGNTSGDVLDQFTNTDAGGNIFK